MTFTDKYKLPIILVAAAIVIIIGYFYYQNSHHDSVVGDIHIHGDFKVFLNGVAYNFSQSKYMSDENHHLNPFFHVHDGDGEVVHQHMSGVKIGTFFSSLNMTLNSTCFVLDNGTKYCNDSQNSLKMYVKHSGGSWQQTSDYGNFLMSDLDQILISYGNDTPGQLQSQMSSVTDRACIQSEKCPERGSPHNESSCTGTGPCQA